MNCCIYINNIFIIFYLPNFFIIFRFCYVICACSDSKTLEKYICRYCSDFCF